MKCDLYLVCRPTLRHLAPYVPPEFSFLLSALKDEPERSYAAGHSNGMVRNLDPALVDPLIEWGRQEWRGATLIDAVRIYEVYEPEDLVDSPVVELFKAPGAPTRYISNFDGAIQHFWACEYCTRFTTRQVKDLNVRPGRGPEVQWTWQAHLIVAARVRELLAAAGVATRPLLKNSAYFQALPVDRIEMRADLHPLQPGERCPGCGEQTVHRTDWVEGPIPNNTRGLAVRRHE